MHARSSHRTFPRGAARPVLAAALVCLGSGAAFADDDDPTGDEAPLSAEVAAALAPAVTPMPDLSVLLASPVHGVASSGFGWRDDPIRHRARFHRGADFRAERGTPVHAAAAGTVLHAGRRGGYGRMISIAHGNGVVTRYAHLSYIDVKKGQRVGADQIIGRVGSTGRATGPHLHFEVRLSGRSVDPTVAARVADAQREGTPEELLFALAALSPEAQAKRVSALDPPRSRSHKAKADKKISRTHKKPVRRPPRVS